MIFAIESSCDEVSASLVGHDFSVQKNILYSSADIASRTGGVVPEQAARKAEEHIAEVISVTLERYNPHDITALAVTHGPGLIGSLFTGIETAKTLAYLWNKPLIPVYHIFGHMCANMLERDEGVFPRLVLTVSGGHNDIMLWESPLQWKKIGNKIDDAAGECFDKCARMLGLAYPGGPNLSRLAQTATHQYYFPLPKPMMHDASFDMSFSGLKTAVLYTIRDEGGIENFSQEKKADLAWGIEQTITDVLLGKLEKAAKQLGINEIEITGGVSANRVLREKAEILAIKKKWNFRIPAKLVYCTDNAAMIGAAGNILWKYSEDKIFDFKNVAVKIIE